MLVVKIEKWYLFSKQFFINKFTSEQGQKFLILSWVKDIIKTIVIKRDTIWICNDSIFLGFSIRCLIMIRTMIFHNILEKYQSVITYVSVIITTGVGCRQVIILSHRNQKLVIQAQRKKSSLFSNRHFDVMSTNVISFC